MVAWRAEPGAAGTGTTTQHLIAELSAIHRDDGASPKLRVASATVQSRDGRATLTEFKTITPHTGMGLREPLCRALEERHEIWQGEPTFSLDKHTPDSKLTVDALKRCHFRPGLAQQRGFFDKLFGR